MTKIKAITCLEASESRNVPLEHILTNSQVGVQNVTVTEAMEDVLTDIHAKLVHSPT